MSSARKIGRPLKEPAPGQRMSLGLKVTANIKSKLDQAARDSGRTQSQEAELRLERSFTEERGWGGPALQNMAMQLVSTFALRGNNSSADGRSPEQWMADVPHYRAAACGVAEALYRHLPSTDKQERNLFIQAIIGALKTEFLRDHPPKESTDE